MSRTPSPISTRTTEPSFGIGRFLVASVPVCPSSGPDASFPGKPVELAWSAVGVAKVTISIDGTGVFDEFSADGSAALPFACSGPPHSLQRHEYTISTVGGSRVDRRKLTVEARVN